MVTKTMVREPEDVLDLLTREAKFFRHSDRTNSVKHPDDSISNVSGFVVEILHVTLLHREMSRFDVDTHLPRRARAGPRLKLLIQQTLFCLLWVSEVHSLQKRYIVPSSSSAFPRFW